MRYIKKCILLILAMAIFVSTVAMSASATSDIAWGAATVSATSLNVRTGAGTDYDRVTSLVKGDRLVVLEKTNSEWWKVNYCGNKGYVKVEYLTDALTAENFNATGTVTGDGVRIRKTNSTTANIIGVCEKGAQLSVIGINDGWYKVIYNGQNGYIRSDLMDITGGSKAVSTSSSKGQKIVDEALKYLGCNYVYGAEGQKGSNGERRFDCSGLVYYVYKNVFGYDVTRTASQQYKNDGVKVNKADLQPGDLVFFSSNGYSVTHVGIYIGDNEFIHASTSDTGVIISNLTSAYYTRVWFGAKRIVGT